MTVRSRVHFDHPPISEVVCGVGFPVVSGLGSAHLGLLWQRWSVNYPVTSDQPPLPPMNDGSPSQPQLHLDTSLTPRVWFASEDGSRLIQVQPNRFHHNWRKLAGEGSYPRFPVIYGEFRARLDDFVSFLVEGGAQRPTWDRFELSYINRIPLAVEPGGPESIGAILPDLAWDLRDGRILPPPDQQGWEARFPLAEDRTLWVAARPARDLATGGRVLALDLTVRGATSDGGLDSWFPAAHDAIVSAFVDLTAMEAQRVRWGRQEGGER